MLQQSSAFHGQKGHHKNKLGRQISRQGKSHKSLGLSKNIFQLEDVTVDFGKIVALKNVHLSIEAGEVVFVTGSSGAGKTTLLRVLCGEVRPTQGNAFGPTDQLGHSVFISKVFQDLRLIPNWSCEENLMAAYDSSTYSSKREFVSDMNEMARVLGFSDRMELKISQANGGLKQKVAIARALLTRPDIFIADEPTSSLDADNARRIFDILNLYNTKKGMTVIWASHDKEMVKRFTGRIIHMDQGKLVYSGHACFI